MLYAVIMAGGSGKRFWPAGRARIPKQLLAIASERTMVQETIARLGPAFPGERIMVVTSAAQAPELARQLPRLRRRSIVVEPEGRDTAACVGLAAVLISKRDPDGVMAVIPADHVIKPASAFMGAVRAAADVALRERALVTFGIKPTHPATGYGYLRRGKRFPGPRKLKLYRVEEFKEKPDPRTARRYLAAGRYYWNSGIFVWRASTILEEIERCLPEHGSLLARIAAASEKERGRVIRAVYPKFKRISIDFGVMERARDVRAIEAPFEWDDAGSWAALARLRRPDASGNVVAAPHVGIDTSGCIIVSRAGRLIATAGLKDTIIVDTGDALLVVPKDRAEDVKKIVDRLDARYL